LHASSGKGGGKKEKGRSEANKWAHHKVATVEKNQKKIEKGKKDDKDWSNRLTGVGGEQKTTGVGFFKQKKNPLNQLEGRWRKGGGEKGNQKTYVTKDHEIVWLPEGV